jgi:hypothetical protein
VPRKYKIDLQAESILLCGVKRITIITGQVVVIELEESIMAITSRAS